MDRIITFDMFTLHPAMRLADRLYPYDLCQTSYCFCLGLAVGLNEHRRKHRSLRSATRLLFTGHKAIV